MFYTEVLVYTEVMVYIEALMCSILIVHAGKYCHGDGAIMLLLWL